MPKRIQRKRSKGWKMPDNCIYVGRPTRWGNPFLPHSHRDVRIFDLSCLTYRQISYEKANETFPLWVGNIEHSLALYRVWALAYQCHMRVHGGDPWRDLRGKDLACWCPLDLPCHADILLELANR